MEPQVRAGFTFFCHKHKLRAQRGKRALQAKQIYRLSQMIPFLNFFVSITGQLWLFL